MSELIILNYDHYRIITVPTGSCFFLFSVFRTCSEIFLRGGPCVGSIRFVSGLDGVVRARAQCSRTSIAAHANQSRSLPSGGTDVHAELE